ncbi:hypothetical protein G5C60_32165 [Streptomyces sp. HC44]|uniref:FAD-binding domain-containing protein n=1 Tax=Streptomyces scabichelini TaxID=2711217 RepID=A0A6G4VDI3_9ACTN|nr:hypothetical protein [Streptomyces scabichelini]
MVVEPAFQHRAFVGVQGGLAALSRHARILARPIPNPPGVFTRPRPVQPPSIPSTSSRSPSRTSSRLGTSPWYEPATHVNISPSNQATSDRTCRAGDGAVRRTLFPEHGGPVYSGFTIWRIVTAVPGVRFVAQETWGSGRFWGTQPLKDGRVHTYAAAKVPGGGRATDDERAELVRLFGDWHDPIPAVIAAVRPEDVLRHDVRHIAEPLPAFHGGRVALLGDAAHAMPPTLGQGGNQAIEDAVVLAHHADPEGPDLAAYTADRKPRTTAIARKAVGAGRLSLMRSRPGIALRNATIAAVSKAAPALLLRSFDGIADWRPPKPPYASDQAHTRQAHTRQAHP